MSAIATAAIGGAILTSDAARRSGNIQAAAANRASDAALQGTRESNALQWAMYQQGLRNQQPYLQGGQTAYAALLGGMGLQPAMQAGQTPPGMMFTGGTQGFNEATGQTMPLGGPTFNNAQGQTVDAQGNLVTPQFQAQNYGATPEQMTAAASQMAGPGGAGRFTQTFAPSDLTTDPSYQWRLEQGLRAMRGQQSARGLLGSSQAQTDLNNYAQGAASQEYQAAYDRFMNNQNTAYSRLAGLAGIGSTTAGNMASAGQTAAGNIADTTMRGISASNDYLTGGAAARGAGAVGAANAISGSANTGIQNWMGMQYLNRPSVAQPTSTTTTNIDLRNPFAGARLGPTQ